MIWDSELLDTFTENRSMNIHAHSRNTKIRSFLLGLVLALAVAAGAFGAPSTLSLHTPVTLPADI